MKNRIIIGLTGSIGMGKSTTAAMFMARGIPVWGADDAVHRLYKRHGKGQRAVEKIAPQAIVNHEVSRPLLKKWIGQDDVKLKQIEAVIHPLVAQDREFFLSQHPTGLLVLDVPLLFETGLESLVDHIVVVSVDAELQKERVLSRSGMDLSDFNHILSQQMPDIEKRTRADTLIETYNMVHTQSAVDALIAKLTGQLHA